MRALAPGREGFVERPDGLRVCYEVYGAGDPTVVLLMPDVIVHSRAWKAQIPFLARSFQVIVLDPPGNGRSDVPTEAAALSDRELVDDVWRVLDTVGVERAVLVGICTGGGLAVQMAAEEPDRVRGIVPINPAMALAPPLPHKLVYDFDAVLDTDVGWAKKNRHYWLRDWPGFTEFFFHELFPEPHSTKQIEDCIGWASTTTPETMLLEAASGVRPISEPASATELCRRVRCPVLVITGSLDRCQAPERGAVVAELTGGRHVRIDGAGHLPQARDPVKVNLLLRDFVRNLPPDRRRSARPALAEVS